MNRASLEFLVRRWRWYRTLRELGIGTAVSGVIMGLVFPFHPLIAAVLGIATAAAAVVARCRRFPPITADLLAEHLNRQCPALEESAGLWLRDPEDLNLVERLQLRRLNDSWNRQPSPRPGTPPFNRLMPILAAAVFSALFLGMVVVTRPAPGTQRAQLPQTPPPPAAKSTPILSASLEIEPPAYLGRPPRRIDRLSAEVEEGSEVRWSFNMAPHVIGLELSTHGTNDTLVAQSMGKGRFQLRRVIVANLVYQLACRTSDGSRVLLPALHVLQVTRDTPPNLTWRWPSIPRTTLHSTSNLAPLPIEILASDDHAVAEVRLVLTVVKGSGEGLRFREQSEILNSRSLPASSNLSYGKSLDLTALGLDPGDELYLHAIALDSRRPIPNESRSETRRVTLAGLSATAGEAAVTLSGLRRVPQYFRSQRQLILDTEQLLSERPSLSEAQFRTRSENIGIDQKLLRLRYGQFLGEEFEPDSAGAPREAVAMEWAATLRNPAGKDAGRAAAIGRAIEATHVHEPSPGPKPRSGNTQEIQAPLTHNHDSPEAATLFDDRLKASLRDVLAAMWEAEGFLRTAQPAAALPSENRALEILKLIQQADRLSVGRVGSDPLPLPVAERRLRGELETIPAFAPGTPHSLRSDPDAAALRQVVAAMAGPATQEIPPEMASRVEAQLWRAAQSQPGRYLPALEQWRARNTPLPPSARDSIRHAVWSLLPETMESPRQRGAFQPRLEQRYAEAMAPPSSRQP
jgi:hypothetical protein